MQTYEIRLFTPLGYLVVQSKNNQIVKLFLDPDQQLPQDSLEGNLENIPDCLLLAKTQVEEYFHGFRKSFDLPYSIPVSEGCKRIYETLLCVPYGKTISYAELAYQSGINHGARAVGCAMSRNTLPIIIPCHRVIRSDGTIGEYSLGGSQNKKLLLQHESYPLVMEKV